MSEKRVFTSPFDIATNYVYIDEIILPTNFASHAAYKHLLKN